MQTYIKEILKPFNFSLMKVEIAGILSAIISAIATFSQDYLGISGAFALVLFVLLITDFITGVSAAKYTKRKITSRKGLRSVYKAGAYLLFIYVAFQLYQELEGKAELFETIVKYFHIYIVVHVCFWELFSIDENLKKLGMDLGITNVLKNTYQGIKNIFSNIGKPKHDEPHIEEPQIDEGQDI